MSDDNPRLCDICREKPVGPGGIMCPDCFTRIDYAAKNHPYGQPSTDAGE